MSIWEECLGNAPTDSLALISLYVSSNQIAQAVHLIQLYGATSCIESSTVISMNELVKSDSIALIKTIEELIAFRVQTVEESISQLAS